MAAIHLNDLGMERYNIMQRVLMRQWTLPEKCVWFGEKLISPTRASAFMKF